MNSTKALDVSHVTATNTFISAHCSNLLVNCFIKFMNSLFCSFVIVILASFLYLMIRKHVTNINNGKIDMTFMILCAICTHQLCEKTTFSTLSHENSISTNCVHCKHTCIYLGSCNCISCQAVLSLSHCIMYIH